MPYPLLLHAKHDERPLTYGAVGEWLVPLRFRSFEVEYDALRRGVGLIDYSTQALLEVRGADRAAFLHNLLTNDVKRLCPGAGCQAALLTATAKVVAHGLVLADQDALWFLCDATRAVVVAQTLAQYLFTEDVTVTNHERAQAVLALQGPKASEALGQLFGRELTLLTPGDHATAALEDMPLRLIRHSLTGGVGFLCVCPAEQAARIWHWLAQRGREVGLERVGWEALNTVRIEAGIPWYGIDMDASTLLPETGLEAVVASDTKGCYLGQEIVARMRTYGSANKKLMGLQIDGRQPPNPGAGLWRDGVEVGWITSACFSPTLQQPIGLGYLKRGSYEPGTIVEVLNETGRLTATVVQRPLVQNRIG